MKLILNFEISHLVALCTVLYPFLAYYGYGSNTFALILALLLFIYIGDIWSLCTLCQCFAL